MKAGAIGIRLFFFEDRRSHVGAARILPRTRRRGSRWSECSDARQCPDRWLRSEATWTEMAARSQRGETMRDKLIADIASERAALKAAAAS